MNHQNYSDYIIYVDESGDHSLDSIDSNYPIFVLSFCIFNKCEYMTKITPTIQNFKFKYFGHDAVVLHEHEIRKSKGYFGILFDQTIRSEFFSDLNEIIEISQFTLIATVIKKSELLSKYTQPENPYHIALGFGLERIHKFLEQNGQAEKVTHVIFEKRGLKEDNELELQFRRVCDGDNFHKKSLPFKIILADKRINSGGLQLADLTARPIGVSLLRPNQNNRAYDIIKEKLYKSPQGKIDGWGLKCFP